MDSVTTDVDELLAELHRAGKEPDRELLDQVKACGQSGVQRLIAMAIDESLHFADQDNPEVWVPLHAIKLLGELGAAEAIEPLLPLFAWDDDWLGQALPECFGLIGAPALSPLRDLLFDRTHDIWARARAGDALQKIAEHHPELRGEVVAALIRRLDPAESRTPEDETLNGLVISQLLDLKSEEALPAIQRAYDEDRVDRRIVALADVERGLGLLEGAPSKPDFEDWLAGTAPFPQSEKTGMRLWLRCTACRYERDHRVEKVYCDTDMLDRSKGGGETPYSPFIIPQRITCPKCGSVNQYELTNDAHLAITAEMIKMSLAKREAQPTPEDEAGPLVLRSFRLTDGRQMHPYAAREMYRQQIEAEPNRSDARVRYGNVLQFLGEREEAARQYRAAIEADPAMVEGHLNLGKLALEDGDLQEAHEMFERVLELAPTSRLSSEDRNEYQRYAREMVDEIDDLGHSPSAITADSLFPEALRLWSPRNSPALRQPVGVRRAHKVGRNDPCPCGSGKKYKKCCGR
jgi:tetratricopeptide (TPR) repeat protein